MSDQVVNGGADGREAALPSERVLVLAPVGRDAALLCDVLVRAALTAVACADMSVLLGYLEGGAGALLLTEEALAPAAVARLLEALSAQPEWADLPMVLLAGGELLADGQAISALRSAGNLTMLERPVRGLTLVTAMQAALRDRRRQYEIQALIQRERASRRTAEMASQVKDEFLATVSHELRTPLSAILLWSRILQQRGRIDDEQAQHALGAIERSAEMQSKLIEDLLDVARMTSGKLDLDLQPADLGPLVEASLDIVHPSAEAKGILLQADIDPGAFLVRADAGRIQQVIWNLLSNAVKFTQSGGQVAVRLQRRGDHARIEVSDTGRGIDRQFLPHVFERFRQANVSPQRLQGGLGLGLAISRQLIELHGGTIRADSPGEGQGAVFILELPMSPAAGRSAVAAPTAAHETPPPAAPRGPLEGVRVLVVEDDLGMQEAMEFALGQYGAEVTSVGSAPEALEVLETAAPSSRPHVVLSDFSLPGMDGYELLSQIRAMTGARHEPAPPVALITAYARPEDRTRAMAAGFSAYLAKPMEPVQLLTVVEQLVGKAAGRPDHHWIEGAH